MTAPVSPPDAGALSEDDVEAPADIRMDAYYFGFERTGVGIIDRILSEVAAAGKAYHHTESWADGWNDFDSGEQSHEQRIQKAANEAARIVAAAVEEAQTKALAQGWDEGYRARFNDESKPIGKWTPNPREVRDAGQGGGSSCAR